jgi:hypothetical protein
MVTQVQPRADAGDLEDKANQLMAAYFAAAMLGLVALFTCADMVSVVLQNHKATSHGTLMKQVVLLIRCHSLFSCSSISWTKSRDRNVRSVLLRKVPGFTSLGHALVFSVYLGINIILIFQGLNFSVPSHAGKRLGWLVVSKPDQWIFCL